MLVNILVYPGMTMLDAMGPYEVLSRLPEARVQFVALNSEPITSDTGCMTFLPTCGLDSAAQADVLLVPEHEDIKTGADMKQRYKETSRGGLAVNVIEC